MKNLNAYPTSENNKEQIGLEKINHVLERSSELLNKMGIPVDQECRIQIEKFENFPREKIFKDKIREDRFKERFKYDQRENQLGEQFEKLKTALLQKFFKNDFIVCRTSFFDDVLNGVDNIIVDAHSGQIICAIDEVGDVHSKRYEEKRQKVNDVNRMGGVSIDYGFKMDLENKKIILSSLSNIPLFFLGLNELYIKKAVKEFNENEISDFEKNTIIYFIQSLKEQTELLLKICPENSLVTPKLRDFQGLIVSITKRYNLTPIKK